MFKLLSVLKDRILDKNQKSVKDLLNNMEDKITEISHEELSSDVVKKITTKKGKRDPVKRNKTTK